MLQKTFMVGIPSLGPSWVANEFGSHYCIGQEETDNHALSTHTHTRTHFLLGAVPDCFSDTLTNTHTYTHTYTQT